MEAVSILRDFGMAGVVVWAFWFVLTKISPRLENMQGEHQRQIVVLDELVERARKLNQVK